MDNQTERLDGLKNIIENLKHKLDFDITSGCIQTKEQLQKQLEGYQSRIRLEGIMKAGLDTDVVEQEVEKFAKASKVFEEQFSFKQFAIQFKGVIERVEADEFKEYLAAIQRDLDNNDLKEVKKHYKVFMDNFNDKIISTYPNELQIEANRLRDDMGELEPLAEALPDKIADEVTVVAEKTPKQEMGVVQRIKSFFVEKNHNPYEGQEITLEGEEEQLNSEEKDGLQRIFEVFNKKKVKKVVCGVVLLTGLGFGGCAIHKAMADSQDQVLEQSPKVVESLVDLAEVDDQEVQINNVYDLTAKLMQAGYDLSPEKVDDWYILMNIQSMDDKTYTKLMMDSKTDSQKMVEHFNEVNVAIGDYYSKNVDTKLDVYRYVINTEDSDKVKETEEAIMEAKLGDNSHLKDLMMSRVTNKVAVSSHGAIEMSIINMFYQQTGTYNANVIGQQVMDFYNNEPACEKLGTMTFLSVAGSELHQSIDLKEEARIKYQGTEKLSYETYLGTLPDSQNDNKVYIENIVTEKIKEAGIKVATPLNQAIDSVKSTVTQATSKGVKKVTSTVKTVVKAPTTEAEKKVQKEFEQKAEQKAKEEVKEVVNNYAKDHNGKVTQDKNGNYTIKIPGEEDLTVKEDGSKFENVEMLDPSTEGKDWFKDYDSYKDANQNKVEHVDGVGGVVVEDDQYDLEDGFHWENGKIYDDKGNLILHGNKEQVDAVVEEENSKHSDTDGWVIKDESNITVVSIDDEEDIIDNSKPSNGNNNSSNNNGSSNNDNSSNGSNDNDSSIDDSGLTEEEKKELEDILNAGKDPVPGDIVDDTFEPIVWNGMTENEIRAAGLWDDYQAYLASKKTLSVKSVSMANQIKDLQEVKAEVQSLQTAAEQVTTGSAIKVK